MSPLTLYINVCRTFLQPSSTLDQASNETWDESSRKLRKLRQLLLCKMCKSLCEEAYGTSNCQHLVCKDCKIRKKSNILGCRYCKIAVDLSVDKQTSSLLRCYAKLCEILYSYYIPGQSTSRNERIEKIFDIVIEGVELAEKIRTKEIQNEHIDKNVQRSCSSFDDVGHVSQQNNVEQDGGNIKDGAECNTTEMKYSHILSTVETEEKPSSASHLNNCEVLDEKPQNTINNDFDAFKIESENIHEKQDNKQDREEKTVEENYTDVMSLDTGTVLNGDISSLNHKTNKRLEKNVQPSFVHDKDFNRTPKLAFAKRKLRNNTQTSDKVIKSEENEIKSQTVFKFKRRRTTKDFLPHIEEKQVNFENDGELAVNENGNINSSREKNKLDPVLNNNLSKMNTLGTKESAKSHNSVNLKTKLFRKNKYKCMCGASGIKFSTEICKHSRCVCFAAKVPCVNCKCRFCSNPHISGPDTTLPSFSQNGILEEKHEDAGHGELRIT